MEANERSVVTIFGKRNSLNSTDELMQFVQICTKPGMIEMYDNLRQQWNSISIEYNKTVNFLSNECKNAANSVLYREYIDLHQSFSILNNTDHIRYKNLEKYIESRANENNIKIDMLHTALVDKFDDANAHNCCKYLFSRRSPISFFGTSQP